MKDKVDPGQYFEYRTGISTGNEMFPGWNGMMPDADPGSLPPNRLVRAVNVRYEAGSVRTRWGRKSLGKIMEAWPDRSTYDGWGTPGEDIQYLGTHHLQEKSPRLWMASPPGCSGYNASPGTTVKWYDPDKNPELQWAAIFMSVGGGSVMAPYMGSMYFSGGGTLNLINKTNAGAANLVQSSTTVVAEYGDFYVTAMCEYDGKLFMAMQSRLNITASKVMVWDGLSLKDSLPLVEDYPITSMIVWRDSHLVGVSAGNPTTDIWVYSTAGGWGSGANPLPASLDAAMAGDMVEYGDDIFIASGGKAIYKLSDLSGAQTVTTAHTLADGEIFGIAVLGENLYYCYLVTDGRTSWLGMYEPAAEAGNWDDTYKDLSTDLNAGWPVYPNWAPAYSGWGYSGPVKMAALKNRLFIGGYGASLVSHYAPNDPTSEWYRITGMGKVVTDLGLGTVSLPPRCEKSYPMHTLRVG